MNWNDALKVIWLGDYFKINELVVIMLDTFVISAIDKHNVIQLINESYAKLKSIGTNVLKRQSSGIVFNDLTPTSSVIINQEKEEDAWYRLLDESLNYISKRNPITILKEQKTQQKVPKLILEEVVERVHKRQNGCPDRHMLKFLMSVKKAPTL
jgi:tRNA A-37 threonylcarbamoyl transferase component Bud32